MLLDQAAESPVHIPSGADRVLCPSCGGLKRIIKVRVDGMPKPVAPNPYDVPVVLDQAAKVLLAQGQDQVRRAKILAKRQEFAERVAKWSPDRIREELKHIAEAVAAHEEKIAECMRQQMILEDQLTQVLNPPIPQHPGAAPPLKPALTKNPCPF